MSDSAGIAGLMGKPEGFLHKSDEFRHLIEIKPKTLAPRRGI